MTTTTTPKKSAASFIGVILVYLLLVLIVCYGSPFLLAISGLPKINGWLFFQSRISVWAVLALLYLYATHVEKQPFLLWKDKKYKPMFYVGAVFILFAIVLVGGAVLKIVLVAFGQKGISPKLLEFAELFRNNIPLLIFTALTAGVTEELIFRGYMQPRLEKAFNHPAPAIIITAFLFGMLHSPYGTLFQILQPMLIGVVFSIFYWKYRNIKILMICHFVIDVIALLVAVLIGVKG